MWNSTFELGNGNIVRYDTYDIFYIPVNIAFILRHYVTSYTHHTGKKESKKEKEKNVTKNLLPGDSNPDPRIQFQFKRSIYSLSMVIDSFKDVFFGFRVELNL